MLNNTAITDVQWYVYRLPFRSNFVTAHGMMATREGAVVEVTTEEGISGIGEIAPLPQFAGGSLNEALHRLPSLAVHVYRKTLEEALASLRAGSESGRKEDAASCGLEIALLDALGKAKGCGMSTLLSSAGF